jgi:hypothetical protein
VSQVFTVDSSGRSIPFQSPLLHAPESAPQPTRLRAQPSVPTTQAPPAQARVVRPDDYKSIIEIARLSPNVLKDAVDDARRDAASFETPEAPVDTATVLIGAWTILAVIAIFIGLATDIPWPALFIAVFWIGAALRKPKALAGLKSFANSWNAARPGAAAWKAMGDR